MPINRFDRCYNWAGGIIKDNYRVWRLKKLKQSDLNMMQANLCSIVLLYMLAVSVVSSLAFLNTLYTITPNHAKSISSVYAFTFSVQNLATTVMNLTISFPNNFVLSSVTNYQIRIQSAIADGVACSFNPATNQVSMINILMPAGITTMQFQFNTRTSKYAGSSILTFQFMDPVTLISENVTVDIYSALMSCSLTSSTTIVGAPAVYTVHYEPTVQIEAGSFVWLQIDPWGPYLRSNFLTSNTASVCAGQCTMFLSPFYEVVLFSSLYPAATNSSNTLTLNSARNPASTAPINFKIIIIGSDSSSRYMEGPTTFRAYVPNTFNQVAFNLPIKTISAANYDVNLKITLNNPLNSNTYLQVTSIVDLPVSYTFAFNSSSTVPTYTIAPSNIVLGNLASSSIISEPVLLSLGNFTVVNPPFAKKPVLLTFRTLQFIRSRFYVIDEVNVEITANPSTITQSGVSVQTLSIGAVTTYTLWFVSVNNLISGSYVIVNFPLQTSIDTTSTCLSEASGIATSCSITSEKSIRVDLTSVTNAGTNFSITVTKVTNPLVTSPTSSFIMRTQYKDEQSLVDQLNMWMTVQAIEVPLRLVTVTPGSFRVNAMTSYRVDILPSLQIPLQSIVKIQIPAQLGNGMMVVENLSIDGVAASTCVVTVSYSRFLQFHQLCIPSAVRNTSTISILITYMSNSLSFKPTSSFVVEIYNSGYRQQFMSSGISVAMNQTAPIAYFNVTPDYLIVNDNSVYTFQINFQISKFPGDRVLIQFPPEVSLNQPFNCTSLSTNITITCSKTNSEKLLIVLYFTSAIYPNKSLKFTVDNVKNSWYATSSVFTVKTATNDTIFYYQEEGRNVVTYQPAKMNVEINNDNNIVLGGDSKITLTLNTPFTLDQTANHSQFYILIQVPIDFVLNQGKCSLSQESSICTQLTTNLLNITQINYFSSELNVTFTAATSFFEISNNFDIMLCYGTYFVQLNTQIRAARYCQDPCKSCTATKTECTSCQYNLFNYLYTCVESCPDGYSENAVTYICDETISTWTWVQVQTKIVFFPILISSFVAFVIVLIAKFKAPQTSLPTSLTPILSLFQMAIWIFIIIKLTERPFTETNLDYTLPKILNFFAFGCLIVQNWVFFFMQLKNIEQDRYVKAWVINNLNYKILTIHRYLGLALNFKLFRFCYSRFWNIRIFSVPYRKRKNIFPLTRIFSLLNLFLCEMPMVICSLAVVYKKQVNDQLFYTSIECLAITVVCGMFLLIDIFKSKGYFEDFDYVKQRTSLSKIKESFANIDYRQ